jgi:hypothetical protein
MMLRTILTRLHSDSPFHSRPPVWVADVPPDLKRHESA